MGQNLTFLVVLLAAAVCALAAARLARAPSILGYLVVGVLLGPHAIGTTFDSEVVKGFAEFGVVFLMFSIGLEFSLPRLKAMRGLVFGLGLGQLSATALGTTVVALIAYGQSWRAGLVVGLAVSMSSTAIVAKMLSERFELHSRSGRQTMGVLLFQDLAVVPCLILFPALAQPADGFADAMLAALLEAAAALTLLFWAGQRLIRRLFDLVARHRSEELFVLTTLLVALGLAYGTALAGLSLALGAFIGGMLISETIYRHQVEADIRPFRDILLGLFFVTVGMRLDVAYVVDAPGQLIIAAAMLVAGKGAAVMAMTLAARTPFDVALRTSAQLAQAGEFGLILIGLGHTLKLIGNDVFQITLSAMLASMFVAPVLINRASRLGSQLARGDWAHKAKAIHDIAAASMDLADHVILCGYGRTGERIGGFLSAEGIPFLALDLDARRARPTAPTGTRVIFGSADRLEVLLAAGIDRARAVVVSYPDVHSALRVIHHVRARRPDLPIIVRAPDDTAMSQLKRAGATEVVPEVLEGSLTMAAETLGQLGIPMERTMTRIRAVRADRYTSLRDFYRRGDTGGMPPQPTPIPLNERPDDETPDTR